MKPEKCLLLKRPGERCARDAKTRGLCASHYVVARKLVKEGGKTWEQLEKEGKCKAPMRSLGARKFLESDAVMDGKGRG